MPPTTPQTSKSQPWKANWPPSEQTPDSTGHKYMVDGAGAALIDGDCSSKYLRELTSSRKGSEAPHDASQTDYPYMVDGTGALLIDGFSGGGPDGFFAELACSNKGSAHAYMVDGTGSLLIDGASGGDPSGFFIELACSRQPMGKV